VRRGDLAAARAELRRIVALPGLHPELVGIVHLYLADAARRAGELDDARVELALADPGAYPGAGVAQRRALHAMTGSTIAHAASDTEAAAALLVEAVTQAASSKDGLVTATVAEWAAAHALAGGDPEAAAALLGVATAQRGALDVGDPDVRVTLDAVRAGLRRGRRRAPPRPAVAGGGRGAAAGPVIEPADLRLAPLRR